MSGAARQTGTPRRSSQAQHGEALSPANVTAASSKRAAPPSESNGAPKYPRVSSGTSIAAAMSMHCLRANEDVHRKDTLLHREGEAYNVEFDLQLARGCTNTLLCLLFPPKHSVAAMPNNNATMREVGKAIGGLDGVSIIDLYLLSSKSESNAPIDQEAMLSRCIEEEQLRSDYADRICGWLRAVHAAALGPLPVMFVGGRVAWAAFELILSAGRQ